MIDVMSLGRQRADLHGSEKGHVLQGSILVDLPVPTQRPAILIRR